MRSQEQMTVRAADLAERIVDEISQADQDWSAIERQARKLVELVACGADRRAMPT
jgi:type II secretory pathway predicted ATPase ExeA